MSCRGKEGIRQAPFRRETTNKDFSVMMTAREVERSLPICGGRISGVVNRVARQCSDGDGLSHNWEILRSTLKQALTLRSNVQ